MTAFSRQTMGDEARAFRERSMDQSDPEKMSLAALLAASHLHNDPVAGLLEEIAMDAEMLCSATCGTAPPEADKVGLFVMSIERKALAALEIYRRLQLTNDDEEGR